MADERDEIRARINIVDLVSTVVALKRAGKHYKGLCPFHQDRNPSFTVDPQTGRYRCWSCGEAGDIFNWVMKTRNVDFREALEELAEKAGVTLQNRGPVVPASTRQMQKSAMEEALAFFREQISRNTNALEYCERRGLTQQVRQDWEIGYAPDVGEALAVYLKRKGLELSECKNLFLVDQDSSGGFFDKFRGRLMFPIRDERGDLVAFGGRLLGDGHPKYINSSDTPLYRKSRVLYGMSRAREPLNKAKSAVLVEGYLDVIACHRAGVTNALASLGTSFTEDHAKLLKRWVEEVVILYDSDAAGQKAADRAIEILAAEGLRTRIALMPEGDDPDTLLKNEGPQAVQRAVEGGLSPLDYRMQALERRMNPASEAFWPEAVTILASGKSDLEMEKHLVRLAGQYPGLRDPRAAQERLRKMILRERRGKVAAAPKERVRATPEFHPLHEPLDSSELFVFCGLLSTEFRTSSWMVTRNPDLFITGTGVQVAQAIGRAFGDGPPSGEPSVWLAKVEPENVQVLLSDLLHDFRSQRITEETLADAVLHLKRRFEMRQAESLRATDRDSKKNQEILERLKRLHPEEKKRTEDDLF